MRRLLVVLWLVFLTVTLQAQNEQYRLITPTFDDYVDTLTEYGAELLAHDSTLRDYFFDGTPIAARISDILNYLYPHAGSFQQLVQIYNVLAFGGNDQVQRNVWSQRMVEAWLSENDIDLSTVNELHFEDFHITVIPRDFNTDGVDEYLLDVMKGALESRNKCGYAADVVDYLVVQQTDEGYRFVETHLPWNGYSSWYYSGLNGGMVEVDFDDINADGLPEWILLDGGDVGGGPGMGYFNGGRLIILSWRDNGIKILNPEREVLSYSIPSDLCANGVYPTGVEWKFTNIDGDTPLEILQIETDWDNWHCKSTTTITFDWNAEADQYLYSNTQVEYEESQNCVQRDAEEIMWTGDYAAAIPVYERALTLERMMSPDDSYGQNFLDSLNQYLRARAALAYLMTEQPEQAKLLLDVLSNEEPADEAVMQFANVLMEISKANATPLEICVAAYRVFAENYPELLIGFTGEPRYYAAPRYEPSRVGCDAPGMLGDTLSHQELPLSVTPVATLAVLGIDTVRVLESDLNHDDLSEWLIAPDIAGMELFFAPDGAVYRVSSPGIDPFMQSSDMQIWDLPDGNSAIAMTITYPDTYYYLTPPWRCVYDPICGIGGGGIPPVCRVDGTDFSPDSLRMWGINDTQLTPILQMLTCDAHIANFPGQDGLSELSVTLIPFDEATGEELPARPTVYLWNTDEQRYVYQTPPQTIMPTPSPTTEPPPPYTSVERAFDARDFEAVLLMTRDSVTIEEGEYHDLILADYFYRALSLQALGRDDEALSIFVAIHDIAPNHIWGILAALHFETVE